jgi:clan AA aspartic protease (TIGR02281 family)
MRKFLLAGAAFAALGSQAHAYSVVKDWSKPGEAIPVQQIIADDGSTKCWLGMGGTNYLAFNLDFFQNGNVIFRLSSTKSLWSSDGQIQVRFDNGELYNANARLDSIDSKQALSALIKDEGQGKEFLHALWNGNSFHVTAGNVQADFSLTGSATAMLHMHQCRYTIAPEVETALADPTQPHFTPPAAQSAAPPVLVHQDAAHGYTPPTPAQPPSDSHQSVRLHATHGAYYVTALINGIVAQPFQVDTGASSVVIPQDFADYLMQKGALSPKDYQGTGTAVLADGHELKDNVYILRSISIDGVTAHDVECSVAPAGGAFLLGKTFFDRFKSFSIDSTEGTLTLNSFN